MPTAIVLAGGVGSRLYPLTKIVPKPMVPFAGAPLLDYVIETLIQSGFDEIIITARYLGEQIVNYYSGEKLVKPVLLDSKDTADAVRLVAGLIKGKNYFLVSMGDVVTSIPYMVFLENHVKSGVIASIVLKEVDNPLPYGLVYLDENSNVILFCEKPPSLEIYLLSIAFHAVKSPGFHSNLVNAGIYSFKEDIIDILLENTGLMDFGRHVFPYLLETGYAVRGWIAPRNIYWNDIGRVEVYKEAMWDLISGKIEGWSPRGKQVSRGIYLSAESKINGILHPPVYVGKNVVIENGAIVGPYVVLEDNTIVEKNSKISYSIAWRNTHIGENTIIHNSVIMNNATIKNTVKVISSIIGTGCNIEKDIYNSVIEPCSTVSPYENTR
ncbi:MAG: NDP-sugar synthase [Desulfurococcaceae archaeon]